VSSAMALLDDAAIDAGVAGTSWRRADGELEKVARFADFAAALAYVNRVGALAEEAGHHPDIAIHWNEVTLRLSTHSAGGITAADLALAARIDELG